MSEDLIRYDVLAQEALRGVVRKVLSEVAQTGLPGEHHFFITFDTRSPGVRISSRLRGQYPEEMTIVLQHQFWDLNIGDQQFEVGLSFHGIPERLVVPYPAIKSFVDPHASFGLKFDLPEEAEQATDAPVDVVAEVEGPEVAAGAPEAQEEPAKQGPAAEVVSLDAFRKKNG
ncbi:hypothetical protein SAMN05216548_104163 [Faunimonas pinastri]|uniref:Stringent starvation protein B n=1 Tax=Faunimonas pinastri TaxID=1855383 RepID=A0A1H9FMZ4_9HYPH|nr:SspB family protein [Faunimonas pinastri]SEQ39262.1 hypothetical protein SAMN05216548_104163 [Faunimonas pinastri]